MKDEGTGGRGDFRVAQRGKSYLESATPKVREKQGSENSESSPNSAMPEFIP
jgi:hypothetical protein